MSIKKAKKNVTPARPEQYVHKDDELALKGLKKVPFFDKICSKFISTFNEPVRNMLDTSNKIQITEEQLPKIYKMTGDICKKLGIEFPKLYLELNRAPNAYTYGDKTVSITITSGLLECLKDDEIYAVLAHECGHIACHHVLYTTMGTFILGGSAISLEKIFGNNLITNAIMTPIELAFYHWMRCSELSADRAAAICCGNADLVVKTMMRLAGGTNNIRQKINSKAFIQQAQGYDDFIDSSKWNKALQFFITAYHSHPMTSIRAYKTIEWANSSEFKDILRSMKKSTKK